MVSVSDTSLSCSSETRKRGRRKGVARRVYVSEETGSNGNFHALCACQNPKFAANGIINPRKHTLSYSGGAKARQAMLKCEHISADVRTVLQAEEDLCSTRKKAKREESEKKGILRKCLMDDKAAQQVVTSYYQSAGDRRKTAMHEAIARFVYGLNLSARWRRVHSVRLSRKWSTQASRLDTHNVRAVRADPEHRTMSTYQVEITCRQSYLSRYVLFAALTLELTSRAGV